MTDLQIALLGFLDTGDYENSGSISMEVSLVFGSSVNQTDIDQALYSVVEKGFATPYRYNPNMRDYEAIELTRIDSEVWFLVTDNGRALLEGDGKATFLRIYDIFKQQIRKTKRY